MVAARAALAYFVLALALTWPLARHLTTHLPHDLGDPVLVSYLLNWNATVTPLTERWWHPPFFWPGREIMALSEHLLGLSLAGAPLQWAGLSPIAVYNVLFIASFWSAGLAAFVLGRVLTGNALAAFVGGLVFMCAPYRASQLSHLQVLMAPAVPLVFAALHRSIGNGWRWPAIAIACWLWQGLVTGYYLLFVPLIVLVWLAWFAPRDRVLWMRLAMCGAAAGLIVAPLLWRYAAAHAAGGYEREFGEVVALGADVTGLWHVTPLLALWGRILPGSAAEEEIFAGLATLALCAIALSTVPRSQARSNRVVRALLIVALLCAVVAAVGFVFPGRRTIAGLTISLTNPHKQLGLTWTALVLAAFASATVRGAWRARSLAAGYAVIAIVTWILALGPMPHFAGTPVWYAAPYRLLFSYVPGFDELRVPARLWMIALAALSALASLGVAHLLSRGGRARVVVAAFAVAVIVEGAIAGMPMAPLPIAIDIPPQAVAVIEVPANEPMRDAAAMYRSMLHGRPVLNGWSGYAPPEYLRLIGALEREDPTALASALSYGPIAMVIDPRGPYHERYLHIAAALGSRCDPVGARLVCLLASRR